MSKKVKYLLPSVMVDMGGFPVKQPLPTQNIGQWDPFLLLHHARVKFSADRPAKQQGVGPHPHRGFSPVTFVIEGELHHRDSRGNSQIAMKGDVQWMSAGMGIVHSERPSESIVANGGYQEIIQLWINTPAKHKMDQPEYLHIANDDMPVISDDFLTLKLISGNYKDNQGKAMAKSPTLLLWGHGIGAGESVLSVPAGFSSMLYVIKGGLHIKGYGLVEKENLLLFDREGDEIVVQVEKGSEFLLLAGEPIDEPVTQYGPFVMNSQTEIMEAMRDFQMGKMGVLIEDN